MVQALIVAAAIIVASVAIDYGLTNVAQAIENFHADWSRSHGAP